MPETRVSTPQKMTNDSTLIFCNDSICTGTYIGPEFIGSSDVAHQFSNKMSDTVGDKLKELYAEGKYAMVDFSAIKMSTKGMGSGTVIYTLYMPFKKVKNKCDAHTSFDHCGGWDHAPAIGARKYQLKKALLKGEELNISELKTTPEGLQEYWIQWKNNTIQKDCAKGN
ncbi:MAG: hypothetical protein NT150_00510 [Bacteroidetes bacterium]|nr:hypothetical protein [Bacteroidota bacterium]